ncbi:MAG: sensor domain-containing diguanylate cyclase [Elusimicrobiota bacterium]|jgi:diguanylate cyclase (GGDEF)-like protein|nr:sensor domain-containing diguanylate cyclase [Elusimicrobiota bacterium]
MIDKRTSLFYDFYQSLSDRYESIGSLLKKALPLMAEYLNADRIFFFDWIGEQSIISLKMMCIGNKSYYMQEDVFVDKNSPEIIKFMEDGIGDSPTLDYPAVYNLLKWRTPLDSLKTIQSGAPAGNQYGVIRIERLKKNKPFSQSDREILSGLCRELSVKINITEVDHYNTTQLRRALALNELAAVFATSLRLSDGIADILKSIQKTFQFDRTSLFLNDPKSGEFKEAYTSDLSGEIKEIDIKEAAIAGVSEACSKQACTPLIKSDIILSLPMIVQNKHLGWLVFDNMLSRMQISDEDVLSLRQFSSQIALAIDNARLFERVQELSNFDDLTKLALRRFFNEHLEQEIYRSERFNLTFSLILLDIDHFKGINDTYGHAVGDEALKAVSEVIRASLRQTDIPCRYGGDEVLIMLPRTTGEEAEHIAKRLMKKVSEIELPSRVTRGADIKLSISQGLSVFPYDATNGQDLINCADKALYYVKETGRGNWASYSDAIKQEEKDKQDASNGKTDK